MKKLLTILSIIIVATITIVLSCVIANVCPTCAELIIKTDYNYAVVEADEGTGYAWEDLFIYEIQGYISDKPSNSLTLFLTDGTMRIEQACEYFLCTTEADVQCVLSCLDGINC